MKITKDKAREQILDMVGDLFHATVAEMTMPRIYDGRTWEEAKSAVNAAFDSIEDHQKVVLPQEVGEELDDYQAEDIDLLDYLHDVIDSEELRVTRVWMLHDREHRIGILADAYRYGWETEPEAKWYVQTPKEWWMSKEVPEYAGFNRFQGITTGAGSKNEAHQFTRAELKQYHLDGGIFKLVLVEDGEVSR